MKQEPTARTARFQGNFNLYLTVLLGIFILIAVNYLSYRHYWRKDYSLNKYYELSPKTITMLKNLQAPVKITTYLMHSSIGEQLEGLIREYQFHGGEKIQVERIDPMVNMDRAEELQKKFKFTGDENLVIFEYKDRNKYVSESQLAEFEMMGFGGGPRRVKAFKGEPQFTSAIQTIVEGKAGKIYFTTGHGERDLADTRPVGYSDLAQRIKGENMEAIPLNLALTGEIPKDADAIVVSGPRTGFAPVEVQALATYLAQKGKVIMLQDPQVTSGLEPLMESYGIRLQNDMVITKGMTSMGNGMALMSVEAVAVGETYADHPCVRFLKGFNLQLTRARSLALVENAEPSVKSKVTELVKTGKDSWGETNLQERKVQFDASVDHAGPLLTAALYDGGEVPGEGVNVVGTRLMVIGTSSFLVNNSLSGTSVDFFTSALNWMTKREAAIGISPKIPQEYSLSLAPLQQRSVFLMSCVAIPMAALFLGIGIWYRRRR